jgi:hypothetical protein
MGEDKDDEVDIGPTHALMAFPEEERDQYCIDVIKSLADAAENIAKIKGKIPQAKALKAFIKDLQNKRDEIEPVFFYMIKPEFRDVFLDLIKRFSGYAEKKVNEGDKEAES